MNEKTSRARERAISAHANGAPSPNPDDFLWHGASRLATVGIFVLLLLAALYYAQPVMMPVTLALVVGIVLTPIIAWAAHYRVPHWLTAFALVAGMFAATSYAVVLLADPVGEWIERAPEFGVVLREKLQILDRPLAALNDLRESIAGPSKDGEGGMSIDLYAELVRPMLGLLTPALGQIVIFFATLLFFLAGREPLRRRFLTFWADRKARLDALHFLGDMETSLASYFGVVTAINVGLGLVLGVFAYLYGLPSPIVWGLLAFFLNYVPYIGAAIVILLLLGVSLVAFDSLMQAFIPPLFYLVATTIEGQLITPGIVGLRMALNPLLVFLAVAFWTWFWGPFGALLAVPLLIMGNVALNHIFPKTATKLPD